MKTSCPRPPRLERLASIISLSFAVACQDVPPTAPNSIPAPQFDISEARFGDGNPDFFFASPLAADPSTADPEFDDGAANGALRPYVRICQTDGAETVAGCTVDVTGAVTGSSTGLAMTFDAATELYQVNWRTNLLDAALEYRIEVWGVAFEPQDREALLSITFPEDDPLLPGRPRWLFGWRDIDASPSTANCDGTEEFCLVNYGQTLPIKVRVEDFVICPVSRNCAVQFVAAGADAILEVPDETQLATSVQLFIPGQDGTDFPLAFEPCSAEETAAAKAFSAIPTFGPCLKTLTPPEQIVLSQPAVLSYCVEIDEQQILSQLAVPETQHHLVGVHHFSTGGVPNGPILSVEAWPHVAPACGASTSGFASNAEPKGFLQLAQAAGRQLLSLFGPEPLRALDIGGGGEGFKLNSFYLLGLPTKFEYELEGDDFQTGVAGAQHTLRAKATDLNGDPVWGARAGWSVISSPGGDASVATSPVLTGLDGISETTVTLSATGGDNVFDATGLGIADAREVGCTLLGGAAGAASCNGPLAGYDPFQPHTTASSGGVIPVPEGTRLRFTVFGCTPGRGTPAALDGTLSEGEWACAKSTTFPVNLSGGSTKQATLYWMNDDTHFHLAVSVPGTDRQNALRLDWDSDGDAPAGTAEGGAYSAAREGGDDVWEFVPGVGPADKFIDDKCAGSSQSGCGSDDAGFGGGMQTSAAFNNTVGGATVYEMSHALSTGDTCTDADPKKGCGSLLGQAIDLAASAGDMPGFFLTLRLGSGAMGNTQWPGFLSYMRVVIH
jgi:hypothetical protein